MTEQLTFTFDPPTLNPQAELVLAALKRGERLTAFTVLSWSSPILRLAARIEELRRAGHKITTTMIQTEKRRRVAQYSLEVSK